MKRNRIKQIYVILLSITLFHFLLLLISLTIFITKRRLKKKQLELEENEISFIQEVNLSSRNDKIENNTYFSDDFPHLSSSKEYQCYGTCYCEDQDRGISATTTATKTIRTLIFLLTSVSSVIAYNQAKIFFKEECENSFMESCSSSSSIKSEVNRCENVINNNEEEKQNFLCKGNCMENQIAMTMFSGDVLTKLFMKARDIKCEELEMKKEIMAENEDIAKLLFCQQDFFEFCMRNSRVEVKDVDEDTIISQEMCVSFHDCSSGNPSVNCKRK